MKIELHIIQNFAPSNLNRDESGYPKDCEFGGYRRARISSQCFKRAIHMYLDEDSKLKDMMGINTKRLPELIVEKLKEQGKTHENILELIRKILGLKIDDKEGETSYSLFLIKTCADVLADMIAEEWDGLFDAKGKIIDSDRLKRIKSEWEKQLKRKDVIDLALFGRMIADMPEHNVEAATQFAHAISTNRVKMDTDFFTAIDELKPNEGAAMMDLTNFNSSCFYRYINFDLKQFIENLKDIKDSTILKYAVQAFIRACIEAIPSGKQHAYAADNMPSFVLAVVRERKLWSLANAFEVPVYPKMDEGKGLIAQSIIKLDEYWGKMKRYGTEDIKAVMVFSLDDIEINNISSDDNYSYNKAKNLTEFMDVIINHTMVMEK